MPAELLAPAGDWESLKAACANGADAVYFGLSAFNARARAANFTLEELPEVMAYLHKRNVKGFVAFNTLIFTDELDAAIEFIGAMAQAGVDAAIVQDLGLAKLIHTLAPGLAIHGSTQMTLTEPRGIAFVCKLGVERVVLARELSLEEIREITKQSVLPVEVFVHGALCVAYSGQCLTSEALGGRSANRGQCAQACRLPYEMLVDGQYRDLSDKAYLLSPQDLAAYDFIAPLIDAGVISFKIEGRLKGGPYVAATTQTYRKAIDAALAKSEFHLENREQLELAQVFSRGFTPGFLEGNNHQRLVQAKFPKSRGIRVGQVVQCKPNDVVIRSEIDYDLQRGDGLLFDCGTPEIKEPGGRIWNVRREHQYWHVDLGPDFEYANLAGKPVWKTDDPQLKKRLEASYAQEKPTRRTKIDATLRGVIGGPLELTMNGKTATWPGPLEEARKRATTIEEIREPLSRLGDTPYELGELTLDLPANAMVPKSVLNDLRRDVISQFAVRRLTFTRDAQALRSEARAAAAASDTPPRLNVLCRNLEQLKAALAVNVDQVYCDFEDLRTYREAVELAEAAGIPIGLAPVRICKPGEDGLQAIVARAKPDAVLIRNLASIEYFKQALPDAQLIGDFSLNVANPLTAQILFDEGVSILVPSFDLNFEQFAALMRDSRPSQFEAVVHQHMPMFHMEHCVFAAFLSTGKDHRDCGRPCDRHKVDLRDRVGAVFPVLPDTGCRNTVYNSLPQSAAEYAGRMLALGVRRFRIDLLRETADDAKALIEHYRSVIAGRDDGRTTWRKLKALNQLGVTRGTLQLA